MTGENARQDRVLRLTREFDAPVGKLYDAFTNPAVMTQGWSSSFKCLDNYLREHL